MTTRKTTQAIKVSATWTPHAEQAEQMARSAFGELGAGTGLRFEGGRILVRYAVATKMTDPEHTVRVAARIKEISDALERTGTVHTFTTQAGAVASELVDHLPEPVAADAEQEAA